MSNRPGPRKSSLAGNSPVGPAPEPAPAATSSSAPAKADAPKKDPEKLKFGIYLKPALIGRVRAAAPHAMAGYGHPSMSDWLAEVIEKAVQDAEKEFNNGQKYAPADAGKSIGPGRPVSR